MSKGIANAAGTIIATLVLRKAIRETPTNDPAAIKAGALIVAESTRQLKNMFSFDNMMSVADRSFDKFLAK